MDIDKILDDQIHSAPISLPKFIGSACLYIGLGIALIIIFSILRPRNGAVYNRRHKRNSQLLKFKALGNSLFRWLIIVFRTDNTEILNKVGLDAYMFLSFLKLELSYTFVMTLLGVVELPINFMGGKLKRNSDSMDLAALSVANIEDSRFLWTHITIGWISAFVLYYLVYRMNKTFVSLRQKHFLSLEYQQELHNRTLLLLHIPDQLLSSNNGKTVGYYFDSLGLQVHHSQVSISRKVDPLPQLIKKYNLTVLKLEQIIAKYMEKPEQRPTTRTKFIGGYKVDAIDHYSSILLQTGELIRQIRQQSENLPVTNVGFVMYKDVYQAHLAMRELESGLGSKLKYDKDSSYKPPDVILGLNPKDIIWKNIMLTRRRMNLRFTIFLVIYILMFIFGCIPLIYISKLANLSSTSGTIDTNTSGFYSFIKNTKFLAWLIESVIAPILLVIFNLIVQFILRKLSENQALLTKSSVERKVLSRLYGFTLFGNLLVFSSSQAILVLYSSFKQQGVIAVTSIMQVVSDNVNKAGQIFVDTIIATSSFWITQITIRTLAFLFELLQVISIIKIYFSKYLSPQTLRKKKEYNNPVPFTYSVTYAIQAFNFTLVLTFGATAPLILPFGLLNFFVAYLVLKHNLMYVYKTDIQHGGRMWKTVYHRLVFACIFAQLFQLVVFSFKNITDVQWLIALPLPFVTIVIAYTHSCWLSSKIVYIDLNNYNNFVNGFEQESVSDESSINFNQRFCHPAFSRELLRLIIPNDAKKLIPKQLLIDMDDNMYLKEESSSNIAQSNTNNTNNNSLDEFQYEDFSVSSSSTSF